MPEQTVYMPIRLLPLHWKWLTEALLSSAHNMCFHGEIRKKYLSTVILSPPLIQEEQLSVSGKLKCTILVNRLEY